MIELKALQQQVRALEADLTPTGSSDQALHDEWNKAYAAQRTAATFAAWLKDRVTQVAVAWVLGSVFVRFAEDNGLIEYPHIAGPGERTNQARERQQHYYQEHPERDDYDWLREAFAAMSVSPVAAGLFNAAHNPMWTIKPTPFAVKALLDFWRQADESGAIRYDLTDATWDTRFLGDLYQDLSEYAKKTYALLQTPVFVEEFILDYTLNPAIDEFGLDGLRTIDPACGSGHFLLGAFRRILASWKDAEADTDEWVLIARTLGSVHGVDKNPFATAIARFRLMLAAMQAAGETRLTSKIDFPLNIAVGDSLLHGRGASGIQGEFDFGDGPHSYRTEDVADYIKMVDILGVGSYHAVFANPPYITPKDGQERENYRKSYMSCSGKYALSVPFAERIFQLAIRGAQDGIGAGYTGQITANSFMKREFGKKLIEEYFPTIDLTYVIDTSGAYIPGHGTPTVILFGRRRYARSNSTIRAVLGVRGEFGEPDDPAKGLVWQAIVAQVDVPGSASEWVTVADLPRHRFAKHPWSLSGGGADDVTELINSSAVIVLAVRSESVGITSFTLEDDLYLLPAAAAHRQRVDDRWIRPMVVGDALRDWGEENFDSAIFPYDEKFMAVDVGNALLKFMWPCRTTIANNLLFGGKTKVQGGLKWSEYGRLTSSKLRTPLSITFAFVATHNHFVLDRGGKVFNRSAPVIKLPEIATENDHLALLAVLNSSTACFWLKQVSHDKGNRGGERSTARYAWENFYEFTGTKLEQFPLPKDLSPDFGRQLDKLAQDLAKVEPAAICAGSVPTSERLTSARNEHERILGRMIALQEELDWDVYRRYGLLTDQEYAVLAPAPAFLPEIRLGERAFEFLLAERLDGEQGERPWFERHRSTPVTTIPEDWPEEYRRVVEKRIEVIGRDRNIALIERPECKRRWQSDPWEDKEREALTTWLLDKCEDKALWFGPDGQPRPMTVNRLADRLRENPDVVSVARLLAGQDADLFDVLNKILAEEHVPYLAQFRYKAEGLVKRAQWEQTWNLQRQEDKTGERLDIPVPEKYKPADFQKPSFWRHRGKLDVPKERFISYPGASPDADPSLLLGWAGWDHREQAAALITLIEDRSATDGWDAGKLTPLIAGLAEVMPWVRQWHHELDPAFGQSPADAYDAYLTSQRETRHLTDEALASWKPSPTPRTRRRA